MHTLSAVQGCGMTQHEQNTAASEPAPGSFSTVENLPLPLSGSTLDPATSEPQHLGHYRILRILGQGGMGKVYEAYDVKLERTVALKVMLADAWSDAAGRERFLREARTMAKVQNDHVVTVYEVDEAGATPYLAMEFLHGQSLATWIGKGERPRIVDIVRIGKEIALGLAAAHRRGLIHRDIKPGNLWLERLDSGAQSRSVEQPPAGNAGGFRIKILDFGLARPIAGDSSITHSGAIMGTPYYMSPEQARGLPVDGRSDLFSLGVVLYQLCTGKLPFQGANVTAVLTSLAVDSPPPVDRISPYVPGPLSELVMGLLAKDPEMRPQSADDVAAALRAIEKQLPDEHGLLARATLGEISNAATLGPNEQLRTLRNLPPAPAQSKRPTRYWVGVVAMMIGIGGLIAATSPWIPRRPTHAPAAHIVPPVLDKPPLRLGLLFSKTGRMAVSERPILDGMVLAVHDINRSGGVLGHPVEFLGEDCQSDDDIFAQRAEKLIERDGVTCLFGCWTSASRKSVMKVVEKYDRLLFSPMTYEGLEESRNIIYGGAVPNQQVLPALKWTRGFLNKSRWYLVGIDAIHSRGTHAVIRDHAAAIGAEIVGEDLFSKENTGIGDFLTRVNDTKPDLVVSTIAGDTNAILYRALHLINRGGVNIPILSFCATEAELATLTPGELEGHLTAQTYFHTIESPVNREFVRRACERFGADYVVSDQMETTYALVQMWAQAVRAAGSEKCQPLRQALKGLDYDAPQGRVTVDPATQHLVQSIRLGRVCKDGRFEEVYASPKRIAPEPFPKTRTREQWEAFTASLFEQWGHRWYNFEFQMKK
jgi:urea transport system substrate-binding protein